METFILDAITLDSLEIEIKESELIFTSSGNLYESSKIEQTLANYSFEHAITGTDAASFSDQTNKDLFSYLNSSRYSTANFTAY